MFDSYLVLCKYKYKSGAIHLNTIITTINI